MESAFIWSVAKPAMVAGLMAAICAALNEPIWAAIWVALRPAMAAVLIAPI